MNQLLTGSGVSEKKTRASNTFGRTGKDSAAAVWMPMQINPKVLRGKTMTGNLILEIPEQKGSIPQSVIDYANNKGIIIRDVNGKEYN